MRVCACILACLMYCAAAPAGVTLDGSLAPKRNIQSGSIFSVLPSDGRFNPNGVQFHSFGTLSLKKGESLQFIGSNAAKLTVARVTGGQSSTINGEIVCQSDLVLVNRRGITFGKDARLDVTGSFTASTADAVHFSDKTRFPTEIDSRAVLTVNAPIAAFGFTNPKPAAITVNSSTDGLKVSQSRGISLIGGDLSITGRNVKLNALEGRVNLVSVASAGKVKLDPTRRVTSVCLTAPVLGKVIVEGRSSDQSAEIRAEGNRGSILIRSGELRVASALLSTATASGAARGIDINARGDVTIIGGQSQNQFLTAIDTTNSGSGRGGDIRIIAGSVSISGRAHLTANTTGPGRAGDTLLFAPAISIRGARAESLSLGGGDCGTITLDGGRSGSIRIDGAGAEGGEDVSGLVVDSQSTSGNVPGGKGGGIFIYANSLYLLDEAEVSALTKTGGVGGNITIRVIELAMDGFKQGPLQSGDTVTAIEARVGQDDAGQGGAIDIQTDTLTVRNGAAISASTFGRGNAGTITILARKRILLEGAAEPFTGIFARTTHPRSATGRGGDAGNLFIRTPSLHLVGGGSVSTQSVGNGRAGNIDIDLLSGDLTLEAGGSIRSDSRRSGNAGNVFVHDAQRIRLMEGGIIASSALVAAGGTIRLDARDLSLSESSITTTANGNGGQIDVIVERQLRTYRGNITTQSRSNGGQINIDPQVVALDQSRITTRGDDAGGDINIDTLRFIKDEATVLDASSQRGNFGTIRITAPRLDLSGVLINLDPALFSSQLTLNDACRLRRDTGISSFTTTGRTASEPGPGGLNFSMDLAPRK